jgi:DivIVA domain-containing protein
VVGDREAPRERKEQGEPLPTPGDEDSFGEFRVRVPAAIRDVSFPGAARGYERRAVDAYVNQVNRLIAELEVSRSPQSAIRHALDRVGQQTKALLEQARETAEEITASAREEAEESVARARAEAEETLARARAEAEEITASAREAGAEAEDIIASARAEAEKVIGRAKAETDDMVARSNAEAEKTLARSRAEAAERLQRLEGEMTASREQTEARMRELHSETEALWKLRQELVDEIHGMGTRLLEVASGGAARRPSEPAEDLVEATAAVAAAAETEAPAGEGK